MRPFEVRASGRRVLFERLNDKEPMLLVRRALGQQLEQIERTHGRLVRTESGEIAAPFGCGLYGCVFALEDGRALKVSLDASEGPTTERIRQMQLRDEKVGRYPILAMTARIDAVFRLRDRTQWKERTTVVGIVREQVASPGRVPNGVEEGADLYTHGWDTWDEARRSDGDRPGEILGVAMARAGLRLLQGGGPAGRAIGALIADQWRKGHPLMDVHSGNLARRQESVGPGTLPGQIVVYDFGGNASRRFNFEGSGVVGGEERVVLDPREIPPL